MRTETSIAPEPAKFLTHSNDIAASVFSIAGKQSTIYAHLSYMINNIANTAFKLHVFAKLLVELLEINDVLLNIWLVW